MVELMAVIAIISIMAVIIGVGLGGGNESVALGNAQRISSSIFQSARSIALLRQTNARVIIYADQGAQTDPRKFLRYMGVVYDDPETPNTVDWIPANQGTYLPEGVFYIPPGANTTTGLTDATSSTDPILASKFNEQSEIGGANPFSVSFPVTGGTAEQFYWYEFDDKGMSNNPGGTFVLNAGRVISDNPIEIGIENQFAVAGLAIRRIGGVILTDGYEEVDGANN